MRAAILTALMNLTPVAPVDLFRFLRVPAIVLTLRAARGRACSARNCGESRFRRSSSAGAAKSRRR
jgi:hypothetical protein